MYMYIYNTPIAIYKKNSIEILRLGEVVHICSMRRAALFMPRAIKPRK